MSTIETSIPSMLSTTTSSCCERYGIVSFESAPITAEVLIVETYVSTTVLPAVTLSCISPCCTPIKELESTLRYSVWLKSCGSPSAVKVYSTTSDHSYPGGAGGKLLEAESRDNKYRIAKNEVRESVKVTVSPIHQKRSFFNREVVPPVLLVVTTDSPMTPYPDFFSSLESCLGSTNILFHLY